MSIVGWARGANRAAAISGVVISALAMILLWGGIALMTLCR